MITYEKLSIRINSKKKFIRLNKCLWNVRILMRLPQESVIKDAPEGMSISKKTLALNEKLENGG